MRLAATLLLVFAASPGWAAFAADPYRGILITEIVIAPVEREGVEIYNANASGAVDLSGAVLTDRQTSATVEGEVRFPPGTVLGAGQYLFVYTSTTIAFLADTSILPPGMIVFEENDSGSTFEGKPIPDMVNRVGNINLSDIGDDASLLAAGTQRPILPGVNSGAVIDGVFSGATTFFGGAFYLGPDAASPAGDIGFLAREGVSLQRYPHPQDTDRVVADFVLSELTVGRPLVSPPTRLDPASTVLVANRGDDGHLTVVTGLPASPAVAGRVITRAQTTEGQIAPDGDSAIAVDPSLSVLEVVEDLMSGDGITASIATSGNEGQGVQPAAVRYSPGGSRATIGFIGDNSLVTLAGLPSNPTVVSRLVLPVNSDPDDFVLSPVDPDLAVVTLGTFNAATVVRGLSSRTREMFTLPTGTLPQGVIITPSGQRAIVCNALSDSLTVIDDLPGSPFVSATLTSLEGVGDAPQAIALSPRGDIALVTNSFGDTVSVLGHLEAPVPVVLAEVPTGPFPAGVAFLPDGDAAVVADAQGPGLVVVGGLASDPPDPRIVRRLIDPRLSSASFAEQSMLAFSPAPFQAYEVSFAGGASDWAFVDAAPLLVPATAEAGGALSILLPSDDIGYGAWFAPPGVVPLIGRSLHALRGSLSVEHGEGSGGSAQRLRLATRDGSLMAIQTFQSVPGLLEVLGPTPTSAWVLLSLPHEPGDVVTPPAAGGADVGWDAYGIPDGLPGTDTLRLEAAQVSRRPLDSLGSPELLARFTFDAGAEGWVPLGVDGYDLPDFDASQGELVMTVTGASQIGFWYSPLIPGVSTDRLIRATARLSTGIPRGDRPVIRLRALTADFAVISELLLIDQGDDPFGPSPEPRSYDIHLAFPSALRAGGDIRRDLVLAFDLVALGAHGSGDVRLHEIAAWSLPLPPELAE